MSVNFTKNQDDITKAWSHVVDSKDTSNWSLFGYEERSNNIKFQSSGINGLKELVQEFSSSQVQYAFCRVVDNNAGLNKLVLINWQGESSDPSRKGIYASHVSDVANYFKGCSQTLTIRNDDEATPEYLMEQILKKSSSRIINLSKEIGNSTSNNTPVANVSSSYKKIDIKTDISLDRSFWQRQEEEEKQRLEEEKKRAIEKQAQYERERKLREESEAKKLAETIKERDRIIEATRQAERRGSSGSSSQPTSIMTQQSNAREDDSDERVGRRSELIRLERNQETQSLISKGLIKNKRAIFEQAVAQEQLLQQQQKQKPTTTHNIARRPSGTMVSQRLNTFKSLDGGSSASSSASSSTGAVEKLTNGFSKNVNLGGGDNGVQQSGDVVKKAIETVALTNDEESSEAKATIQLGPEGPDVKIAPDTAVDTPMAEAKPESKSEEVDEQEQEEQKQPQLVNNAVATDSNGIKNRMINDTPPPTQADLSLDSSALGDSTVNSNSNVGIRAKALYDYEAADSTEISFDPDDLIGGIEKVDSGWWHGSVITGRFKGLSGLFPSNYVEELSK